VSGANPRERVQRHAPWLLDESLDVCVVGTSALVEACRRGGLATPPTPGDLDLAWRLDVEAGAQLLSSHGALRPTTEGSKARGTLALQLGAERVEITTLRGGIDDDVGSRDERIRADLGYRDMTIGALAWHLASDRVLDPFDGLADWQRGVVRAVGEPAERIAEHPARWLRYYRKAHEWSFALDPAIRRLPAPAADLATRIPSEVVAAEIRSALLGLDSPGALLCELHEAGLLQVLVPELAPQFDGRPAGPIRYHPEISQGLHLVLALRWAARHTRGLPEADRLQVLCAVLVHDLGKADTPAEAWPGHRGHEHASRAWAKRLFDRLPGLGDAGTRRFCDAVCALHLEATRLTRLRTGTLATMFEEHFRDPAVRPDLFALAIGADAGGRLDREQEGERLAGEVRATLERLVAACRSVDAGALREACGDDLERFRQQLHQERARAIQRQIDRG
jgi:tRNA nucleotidyltransferase (CCA-adding enzyme)